jgi:iron complex transport system ATP-binding protein
MGIHADAVCFAYQGAKPVLRDVTLTPEPGKITAIIGPNGSGKTTLLKLLLGLLRPDSGRITLDGRDVAKIGPAARAVQLAYVPQQTAVAFGYTAAQVVELGRHRSGGARSDDRRDAIEALERVDLADRADTPFAELSAGQQQRVTLARALAQLNAPAPPGVTRALLADEPTSAMDPKHALGTMSLLRELTDRGLAVATVLHDLHLVDRCTDLVAVLDANGRLAASGPVRSTLEPPALSRVFDVPFVRVGDARNQVLIPVPDEPDTMD